MFGDLGLEMAAGPTHDKVEVFDRNCRLTLQYLRTHFLQIYMLLVLKYLMSDFTKLF